MTRLHIQTASRLHFGLLGWGPNAPRQFGGIGLMVEDPGLVVTGEPAKRFEAVGPLADRVSALLRRVEGTEAAGVPLRPIRVEIQRAPEEHLGLGVGTQVDLAVSRLLLGLSGVENPSLEQLAALSGRGRRSGIGLHGFHRGGLLVDAGHRAPGSIPPLVARMDFPADWSILIVRPAGPKGRHGPDESTAFAKLPPFPERVTERLCRLVLLDILGAVAERDLETFGAALTELQRHVGAAFAAAQGGVFASPEAELLIAELERLGLVGAGQSSWGPTLYAFGDVSTDRRRAIAQELQARLEPPPREILWTRARNQGALIQPA